MIDPTKPVRLRKMVSCPKTGNIYIPLSDRPFLPGELPAHLVNDTNCYQDGTVEEIYSIPDAPQVIQTQSEEYLASNIPTQTLAPKTKQTKVKSDEPTSEVS